MNDFLLNPWLNEAESYKAGKTFEYVSEKYGIAFENILRLAGNESTIGMSPLAKQAAKQAIDNAHYYDEAKSEKLIYGLEKFFAQSIDMQKLGIVCTNGMDLLIDHAFILFCKAGDSIVSLDPTFIYYEFSAKRLGIEVIKNPINFDRNQKSIKASIDAENLLSKVKANTRMVFLCSPNNPDASVLDLETIEFLAKELKKKQIILFVDHAYIDFCDRNKYDARNIIHQYPNIIIGYTFSKAYGLAGLRLGYGLMHKQLQEIFLSNLTPFLCSKVSLAAGLAALQDKEHLQKILINNQQERPILKQALENLGFQVYNSFANFILFETKIADLSEQLMAQGIILRSFPNLDAIRMTIGQNHENQRVIQAIKGIINA